MKTSLNDHVATRRKGFVLTQGDVEILRLVFEYRLVTVEILCALTRRSAVPLYRRTAKLALHGYIYRIVRPWQKHVFAVTRLGAATLAARGLAGNEVLDKRFRHRELRASFPLFIEHELLLSTIRACLELAVRDSRIELISWLQGPKLYDKVICSSNGKRHALPVRPDAKFVLRDSERPKGANTATFLLEADRSTCSHKRFCDKLRAYWEYSRQGLQEQKFGVKKFRVVTVTLTSERARNLCETAAKVLPEGGRGMFLFTSIENFSMDKPAGILDEVWVRPKDFGAGVRQQLIPPVKPAEGLQHDAGNELNQRGGKNPMTTDMYSSGVRDGGAT